MYVYLKSIKLIFRVCIIGVFQASLMQKSDWGKKEYQSWMFLPTVQFIAYTMLLVLVQVQIDLYPCYSCHQLACLLTVGRGEGKLRQENWSRSWLRHWLEYLEGKACADITFLRKTTSFELKTVGWTHAIVSACLKYCFLPVECWLCNLNAISV